MSNPNVPSPEVIREFPDRSAQWLLADPVHLRDLIQLLQPKLAERLDVSRAERINRTMIPSDLQKKESDLIFRIPYRADGQNTDQVEQEWEVWIYVLLEHQSQHNPLIPLRLLLYTAEPHWDTLFLNLHQTPAQALTLFATAIGYALRVWQAE